MTYAVTDSAAPGENLAIQSGVTVQDTSAGLTFHAGDDATIAYTSGPATTIGAATTVVITVDAGTADATGGTLNVHTGVVITAPGGATFRGANPGAATDADSFNFAPQVSTVLNVQGYSPAATPGDTLKIDLTGRTNSQLLVAAINAGVWTFGNAATVSYSSIETINTVHVGTYYDLILDMEPTLSSADLNADTINVQKNGLNLELRVDGTIAFQGDNTDIQSLRILGGTSTAGAPCRTTRW